MKTIKVMHLLQSNHFSGAESVVISIIKLFQNNSEFEMVYVSPNGSIKDVLIDENIQYYLLEKFNNKCISKAVKTIKPDIIQAHDFNASVRAAQFRDVKIVSHIHHNPPWLSHLNIKTLLYALTSHKFEKVIGVSSAVEEEYIFRRLIAKKFSILPNCVNAREVIAKSQCHISQVESTDILFVGRLAIPKEPLLFLKIVQSIVQIKKDLKVGMVGDGPLRSECEEYIADNHLTNNITLYGFQNNPYPYMCKTKFLIVPSKWEGFGLVAVEAMLLKKPVLCSGVGGLKDIVDQECGMICQSIDDYVLNALELLKSPQLLEKKGVCAHKKVMKYADVEAYRIHIKYIYKELMTTEEIVGLK